MELFVDNCALPLEPFPSFLGITLDPKLNFKMHFEKISKKLVPKINLIKRFKALKIKNRTQLCTTIFKTVVHSLYDLSFVINKILRAIKFYPLKTSINHIHTDLKEVVVVVVILQLPKQRAWIL